MTDLQGSSNIDHSANVIAAKRKLIAARMASGVEEFLTWLANENEKKVIDTLEKLEFYYNNVFGDGVVYSGRVAPDVARMDVKEFLENSKFLGFRDVASPTKGIGVYGVNLNQEVLYCVFCLIYDDHGLITGLNIVRSSVE